MRRIREWKHNGLMILIGLGAMVFFTFAAGCFPGTGGGGCGGSGQSSSVGYTTSSYPTPITAELTPLNPKLSYAPGERMQTNLHASLGTYTGTITFEWYPPVGATNVTFPVGITPQAGGPPYWIYDISAAKASSGITVSYDAPPRNLVTSFWETLSVYQTDTNTPKTATVSYSYSSNLVSGSAVSVPAREPRNSAMAADPGFIWSVLQNNDFKIPLTQTFCQNLIAQAQSANIFFAIRAPLAGAIQDNLSYSLPVVFNPMDSPFTTLSAFPVNVHMPMELRPEMTGWANTHLPQATGELWTTLGVSPQTDLTHACDDATGQPEFSLLSGLSLDLSDRPNGCTGCVISTYFCYKTSLFLPPAASRLWAGRQSLAVGDYTCLGPDETKLMTMADWGLSGVTASQILKPGDPIKLNFQVNNNTGTAHTFNITNTVSSLNVTDWVIHPGQAGDPSTPDLGQTVTGSFGIPAGGMYSLFVMGTVPAGAAPDNYPYHLTITSDGINPASQTESYLLIVTTDGNLPDVVDPAPGVSLTGNSDVSFVTAGSPITYTFTIYNTGAKALTNLVLSDTLPANTTYVACQGADSCNISGGIVTWHLANLGTSQNRSVSLSVRANPGTAGGTVIHNSTYSVDTAETVPASGVSIDITVMHKLFLPLVIR